MEFDVRDWLECCHREKYADQFVRHGWDKFDRLNKLTKNDFKSKIDDKYVLWKNVLELQQRTEKELSAELPVSCAQLESK